VRERLGSSFLCVCNCERSQVQIMCEEPHCASYLRVDASLMEVRLPPGS
jgi:hypothetical protein